MIRLLLLAWAALFFCVPAARAELSVTPELICAVAQSVARSWDERQCQWVSEDLNATAEPRNLLAIAVLESTLDFRSQSWYVRDGRPVVDVGLLAVHCIVGRKGTCTNWPVKGVAPIDSLQVFPANIKAGAAVLAKKRKTCGDRALDCYVGDATGKSGRTADVAAIVAAFGGVEVQAKGKRVRELVRRIAAAVRRERKS